MYTLSYVLFNILFCFYFLFFRLKRSQSGKSFSELLKQRNAAQSDSDESEDNEMQLNGDGASFDRDFSDIDIDSQSDICNNSAESTDNEDDNDDEEPAEEPKWIFEQTFDTKDELDDFMKEEQCWSTRSTRIINSGKKTIYRCNAVASNKVQCEAEVYTLRRIVDDENITDENDKYRYDFYRKNADHTHEGEDVVVSKKVSTKVRDQIIMMYKAGLKPEAIRLRLRSDATISEQMQPSSRQIYNVINVHKNEGFTKDPITMNDLVQFAANNPYDPAMDEDKPFVVKFERSPPNDPRRVFRYFVSTIRLLRMASQANVLHADATYKITTEKLPLVVVGCSDANGQFHLIGEMTSSHETGDAYKCACNAVIEGIAMVTGTVFKPEYLVADADDAIHNGFRGALGGELTIIMCYSHMLGNVQRKYKFNNEMNRNKFMNDLRALHLSADTATFEIGVALLKIKWENVEKEMYATFERSFVRKNFNWFTGAGNRVPKTNNLIEPFNGLLKQSQTLHQRKPLKQFLIESLRIVAERSKAYWLDKSEFATETTITDDQIREGCRFDVKFVGSDKKNDDGENECFSYAANPQKPITMTEVHEWQNATYNSFDEFAANHNKVWKTTFPDDLQNWRAAACTCQAFDDIYMCKHIISIAHQLGIVNEPEANYDNQPLFVPKRGRPAKASKKPLQVD